ncbi:hypothetical protein AVEN_56638-1 [Araneus ventricosus]|uniref:DDE Tnp4 domain-containing protein n=1 Tax=Araneus ventricosus TaxID=182803 RepID=A0A4Y2N9K7_ARAVE|nr:hypothetical protein AVEN_56638-1 [Araneus ventricosus]
MRSSTTPEERLVITLRGFVVSSGTSMEVDGHWHQYPHTLVHQELMILLALWDADYEFTYIDVISSGKSSNSGIFKNSTLYDQLSKGSPDIPAASPLEGGKLYPYVILADQVFAMSENLIRPYGDKCLSDEKNISITASPGQGGALNVYLG